MWVCGHVLADGWVGGRVFVLSENLKQGKWTESEIEAKHTELVEQTRRRSLVLL